MGRALLLRHGQSVWNAEHRWQGRADPPLSAVGEAQALAAARLLREAGVTAVVSSPLLRARRTAELLAGELGLAAPALEPDLAERDVGEWSGLTSEEIDRRWPGVIDEWRAGRLAVIPGGEGDITGRVVPAVRRVLEGAAPAAVLVVVTHGGVISAVERSLDVEPCRARNLCGRWVATSGTHLDGTQPNGAALVAGDAVALVEPGEAAPTTAL